MSSSLAVPQPAETLSNNSGPAVSWLLILLVVLESVLVATVLWLGEGILPVLALALGLPVIGLTLWQSRGQVRSQGLQSVLARTDGERMDISAELSADNDAPDVQAYARMTARLRDMIVDFQQQSLTISVSSAKSRLLAEKANREAKSQQGLS